MKNILTEMHVKALFEQYYIALVEFSWHIVKCRDTASDIVQDTFVKVLERLEELPSQEKALKSYLYSSVRNISLNHIRHQKIADGYQKSNEWNEMDETYILDAMIYAETVNNLHKAIKTLPKSCQEVCKLTYLEGKSNSEAAELCGVSINTIKTQKRRSVELLRHRLAPIFHSLKAFVLFFFG
ncbi:sigma-70 family RNA polymerase sigma factor [Parapedobacter sp. SGR-10]|uniref:sigma-70 family RNA polymerase sigma factor n=1 Tax=Parapedobacter sp. SGR-10 TaxID=2710879 RepID=UPI0013D1B4CA|nr:sigma-70 family RNA polymerase sigma factor [Parapedobacter sp. SGR-10]NGF56420.1 sigma-70 family RNA polymerase sigma factor [Parapedobacter sp. SGR-10]